MPHQLNGRTIAILATDGFEQSELIQPRRALEEAGATVDVIAPKGGTIHGIDHSPARLANPLDQQESTMDAWG